jgi:hypothetical protein
VEALAVIDLIEERADLGLGMRQVAIVGAVHLLLLQGLHEALAMALSYGQATRLMLGWIPAASSRSI